MTVDGTTAKHGSGGHGGRLDGTTTRSRPFNRCNKGKNRAKQHLAKRPSIVCLARLWIYEPVNPSKRILPRAFKRRAMTGALD